MLDPRTVVSIDRVTPLAARRLLACVVAGLVTVLLAPLGPGLDGAAAASGSAAAATSVAGPQAPLRVTIESLTPSTIPQHGAVTVTGTVTNRSDSTWTDLNVYMFTSPTPIRTSDELQDAAATDPTAEVGARLTGSGLYDTVPDLAPGESAGYVLTVPRRDLQISGAPGVYWLGVHVLGASDGGRDSVADGRARQFLPLMPPHGPTTKVSLVFPLKAKVRRDADGRLANVAHWRRLLGIDGRLGRLMQMSETAGPDQVTWVTDPAVLDAAVSVASDNPGFSIEPTTEPPEAGDGGSVTPSPSPSAGESPSGEAAPGTEEKPSQSALVARDWLDMFQRRAHQHTVMTVPYGDLDVASVLRNGYRRTYQKARQLSQQTMEKLQVVATPVVAPANGFLPQVAMRRLDDSSTVLLSDRAMPSAVAPVVDSRQGPRVLLTDSAAGSGGPGPNRRYGAISVRQRILSAAALHALSPDRGQPMVVEVPELWNPGSFWQTADFFAGLDVDWLDPVSLPEVPFSAEQPPPISVRGTRALSYPDALRRQEVPLANLLATHDLVRAGGTLAGLLTENDSVDAVLAQEGLLASSVRARDRPRPVATRVRETTEKVQRLMGRIRIDGPPFVTMSSEEGTITVTIVNGLDEPVTVGVEARTGPGDLVIDAPDPADIPPGQRASVRLRAHARDTRVHPVTLMPVTADGRPLGNVTRFNVRSSHVGFVIWVIMGIGGALLLVAIAIRTVRRIRARRRPVDETVRERETV
jgi:hypothetical protein